MSSPWPEGKCRSRSRSVSVYSRWWSTTHYQILLIRPSKMLLFVFFVFVILPFVSSEDQPLRGTHDDKGTIRYAEIDISFSHPDTKKESKKHFQGRYGSNSVIAHVAGVVMHTLSHSNPKSKSSRTNHSGCSKYVNEKIPSEAWIALVERGVCKFNQKVKIATKVENASAIVIYNNASADSITKMGHEPIGSISVFLERKDGLQVAELLNRGVQVHMSIYPGKEFSVTTSMQNSISRTSVLFVSVSFIVLMVVSLAWLVFYYVQRFRYSHAKERLARLLACAAKKAITKIPQKTIKAGDKELEGDFDQCAVCIEQYKPHDVIRILPCLHVFHKSCVDPWLLDQRSCPMCKLDILRAYGMQVSGSQESMHRDPESGPVTQVVSDEPEVRFNMDGSRAEVLLVPPTWLHVHAGEDMERDGREDEEDEGERAERRRAQGALSSSDCHPGELDVDDITVLLPSSLSSSSAAGGSGQTTSTTNVSRAEKKDREDSANAETKALISPGPQPSDSSPPSSWAGSHSSLHSPHSRKEIDVSVEVNDES